MNTIDTSGPLRVQEVAGKWYVLGDGWCLPARNAGAAAWLLLVLRGKRDVIEQGEVDDGRKERARRGPR